MRLSGISGASRPKAPGRPRTETWSTPRPDQAPSQVSPIRPTGSQGSDTARRRSRASIQNKRNNRKQQPTRWSIAIDPSQPSPAALRAASPLHIAPSSLALSSLLQHTPLDSRFLLHSSLRATPLLLQPSVISQDIPHPQSIHHCPHLSETSEDVFHGTCLHRRHINSPTTPASKRRTDNPR